MDKNLTFISSENARAKLRDVAQLLRKSSQRLKYSWRMMEKEEVIYGPHAVFDYAYFGLLLFRIYFKGGYSSEKDKNNIIKKLSDNPYIVAVYELSGGFDLAIEMEAPNPSRFNKELKKMIEMLPTLNKYRISLNLVTHLYPRSYLTKSIDLVSSIPKEIVIGGDRAVEKFDDKEMKIVKGLLENSRMRWNSLAKKTELNIKTVNKVVKGLRERKIIRGFKYILDTDKLEIYKFRLFLNLHNVSKERETELIDFMSKTREIVQINRTVGDWDMEVDIESFNKAVIRQLVIQLRENFKDLIENFNSIEFYRYYKREYLPKFLVGGE